MSNKEWTAKVQYGDATGRAEADGFGELRKYAKSKGINTSVYEPIGITIQMEETYFGFEIICKDATGQSNKITSFGFEKEQDLHELRKIFERLDVFLLGKQVKPEEYDWSEYDKSTSLTIINHPGGELIGTAATDGHECAISGLKDYLEDKGIDTSMYKPIGIVIQIGASHFEVLCADPTRQDTIPPIKKIISFGFKEQQDLDKLHKIFKRLQVVLLDRDLSPANYDRSDLDSPTMIGDRPE